MKKSYVFTVLGLLTAVCASAADDLAAPRPVGTFGGFIRNGVADIPSSNGFLTFSADSHVEAHRLRWQNLMPGGKDFALAEVNFPGHAEAPSLKFMDWTTLAAQTKVGGAAVTAYLSRTFPAVHYESETTGFSINTAGAAADGVPARAPMARMALVLNGVITTIDLAAQSGRPAGSNALALSRLNPDAMSEPWILLWAGPAAGWPFDAPVLLTLEKRPSRIHTTAAGVAFEFKTPMHALNVMPLKGLKRFAVEEMQSWDAALPADVIVESRAFVERLAAFPVGMQETFALDESAGTVTIRDSYVYRRGSDVWGTVPVPIAPLPPLVVRAGAKGYPVGYPTATPIQSSVRTFYGPFSYVRGESASYVLPLPHALSRLPVAMRVDNSPATAPIRAELERILHEDLPQSPSTFFLPNDDRAAALLCDVYPTLSADSDLRPLARNLGPQLLANSFGASGLTPSIEPVTQQSYLTPAGHSFAGEPFDREWYTGRHLTAVTRCAEALESGVDLARSLWPQITGLYRYDRIFFDWVTGSVTSSVYGLNELADGINFAWEGMLDVARLARLVGDEATYEDAAYRSAREQLALFGVWHQAEWAREIDYGIAHFSAQKIGAGEIETRGAVDAFVEDFGSATLEFRSFWQTTNFLYFDNPAQYAFYRDYGLTDRIHALEYDIMPTLHLHWTDGNVMEPVDARYYGSDNTAAHLLTRAVLFHDDPAALFSLYNSVRGTAVTRTWYSMFFFGAAGPTLLGLERAQAPVVEIPVALARLVSSRFDAASGVVTLELFGRTDGVGTVRMRPVGGEWSQTQVTLQKDQAVTVTLQTDPAATITPQRQPVPAPGQN